MRKIIILALLHLCFLSVYGQDYIESGEDITPEEDWAYSNPIEAVDFFVTSEIASSMTEDYPGQYQGYGDALRHSYWSAMNSELHGTTSALEFGFAHEQSDPYSSPEDMTMDLNNNAWGAVWAESSLNTPLDFEDFENDFNDAVTNGEIIIINENTIPNNI